MNNKFIYCFDVDGTICSITTNQEYEKAIPDYKMIDKINKLYYEGHTVKFYTARGQSSGKSFKELTLHQLFEWGVKYHSISFDKPSADIYVDDKGLRPNEFLENIG